MIGALSTDGCGVLTLPTDLLHRAAARTRPWGQVAEVYSKQSRSGAGVQRDGSAATTGADC